MNVGYYLFRDVLRSIVVIICSGVCIGLWSRLLCMPRFHKEHCGKHLLLKTERFGKVHIQTKVNTYVFLSCVYDNLCRLFLRLFFRVHVYIYTRFCSTMPKMLS
ncbi:unnamed protein product [Ixodes pacificus]